MPSVVMLCPYFPPRGDIAVKRSLRFVRHLRASGWEPVVLSLPNGGGGAVRDPGLLATLPENVRVDYGEPLRAAPRAARTPPAPLSLLRRLELAYYRGVQPSLLRWIPCDRFLLRALDTARRAVRLAHETQAKAIYASSEPTSVLPAAVWAGREAGLPVVLDLRDPWTLEPMSFPQKPRPVQLAESRLESWCFHRAARVILNTERARDAYQRRYPNLAHKFAALRSGFDRSMFEELAPVVAPGFSLVHFGNLYRHRGVEPLLRAMSELVAEGLDMRLACYGKVRPADRATAKSLGIEHRLIERAPIPYAASLGVLRGAGGLLLTQPPQTSVQIPGKLYDYLCAGRPIVALSNNPEIDEIIARAGAGYSLRPADTSGLKTALRNLARNAAPQARDESYISSYDAPAQARALAHYFDEAARR
jgi:glycosyltransferase involved in cell wall biosynthesis